MAQSDYGNPASPFSGTQLNNRIRDWRDALHTLHRGTSRPSYAQAGMMWIREISGTQWEVLLYDGADDILIATVNPTTNISKPAIPSAAIGTTQIAAGAVTEEKLAPGLPFLPTSGGTLTGPLNVAAGASNGIRVAGDTNTAIVQSATSTWSVRTGGSERLSVSNTAITAAVPIVLPGNPTVDTHAATKQYVDAHDRYGQSAAISINGLTEYLFSNLVPDDANEVTLVLTAVSLSDDSTNLAFQIGSGTGYQTSGYVAASHVTASSGVGSISNNTFLLYRQFNVRFHTGRWRFFRRRQTADWYGEYAGMAGENPVFSATLSQVQAYGYVTIGGSGHLNTLRIVPLSSGPTLSGSVSLMWRR